MSRITWTGRQEAFELGHYVPQFPLERLRQVRRALDTLTLGRLLETPSQVGALCPKTRW